MRRILIPVHVVVLMLCLGLNTAAAEVAGEVAFVRGPVQLLRGEARMTAVLRMPVMQGDAVVTGDAAVAKLLMRDDSVFTVYPDSRLDINEYVYDPAKKRAQSVLKLLLGKLRAVISRATVSLSTRTAVAGIKGTVLDIWYDAGAQTTWLAVYEGSAEIRNIRTEIKGVRVVKAGQMTSVPVNEAPRPVQPIPAKKRGAVAEDEDDGLGRLPALDIQKGSTGEIGRPERLSKPDIDLQPRGQQSTPVDVNVLFP